MRGVVIGAYGQLGTDLMTALAARPGVEAIPLGHADVEITNLAQVETTLNGLQPEFVINCAAYNLVDQAEEEPEVAYAVNALGPRNLARACQRRGVVLMHVSTDYVFGAAGHRPAPYSESEVPGPVSAYGTSKLAGEYFVQAECARHFIVRTCGLYGHRAARGKGNFVETMLRLGRERPELKVVSDNRCTPTATRDLADWIVKLIHTEKYGTYHATNNGDCSWYEFATEIFRLAEIAVRVLPVPTSAFPTKARRPPYSVLDNQRLEAAIGQPLPTWHAALAEYLRARPESPPST